MGSSFRELGKFSSIYWMYTITTKNLVKNMYMNIWVSFNVWLKKKLKI